MPGFLVHGPLRPGDPCGDVINILGRGPHNVKSAFGVQDGDRRVRKCTSHVRMITSHVKPLA
eukprot:9592614-Prorocentrum_lima.AAC.1